MHGQHRKPVQLQAGVSSAKAGVTVGWSIVSSQQERGRYRKPVHLQTGASPGKQELLQAGVSSVVKGTAICLRICTESMEDRFGCET